ncbi:MAG: hypothetical protein JNK65_08170 [Deltaproteobacteria bacterium]|nr:hypothetical protein [Deltaproteobacteria bacterium]
MRALALSKYLTRHLEKEAQDFDGSLPTFDQGLTIPIYDEDFSFFDTLQSIPTHSKTLAVLVVNAKKNSIQDIIQKNQTLIQEIKRRYSSLQSNLKSEHLSLHKSNFGAILLVDLSRPETLLKPKQGVGQARKVGCDLIFKLIHQQKIKSHWIYTTDADAVLPSDYFERIPLNVQAGAALFPYTHSLSSDHKTNEAIISYEIFLRYLHLGLQAADSPYAYSSIGSTLALDANTYAEALGFPDREAGEDFYLLNKIIKIRSLLKLTGNPIILSGRVSHRVPFGTGKAIREISEGFLENKPYSIYHPDVFLYLKCFHASLIQYAQTRSVNHFTNYFSQQLQSHSLQDISEDFFHAFNIQKNYETTFAKNSNSKQLLRNLQTWFDAFKTLKFLHWIEEKYLAPLELNHAIDQAFFLKKKSSCSLKDLQEWLIQEEQIILEKNPFQKLSLS